MYPHEMSRSTFYAQINAHLDWARLTPISWLKTQAEWRPIKQWDSPVEFAHYLLSRIPTEAIYLTLEKDGLRVPATPASWLKKQWTRFGLNEFPPHLYNVAELKQINERTNIQILNAFI